MDHNHDQALLFIFARQSLWIKLSQKILDTILNSIQNGKSQCVILTLLCNAKRKSMLKDSKLPNSWFRMLKKLYNLNVKATLTKHCHVRKRDQSYIVLLFSVSSTSDSIRKNYKYEDEMCRNIQIVLFQSNSQIRKGICLYANANTNTNVFAEVFPSSILLPRRQTPVGPSDTF